MGRRAPKTGRGLAARRRGRLTASKCASCTGMRKTARMGGGAPVARQRRGAGCLQIGVRGKLRPNARHARVGARGRQRAWAVLCLRRAPKTGRGLAAKRRGRLTASKRASCTGMSKTARMGRGVPAACPGFARRGMAGITRLCPLVAGSRAPVRHGKGVPMATALCHKKARGCA